MFETAQQALLDGDVEKLLAFDPEGNESILIMNGGMQKFTCERSKLDFQNQFKNGKYSEVSELIEPIINVSPDGKMAWVAGQWKVAFKSNNSSTDDNTWETTIAWLSVREKKNDKWVSVIDSQTFKND